MPSPLLVAVAWVAIALGVGCAVEIVYDMYGRGFRQRMTIMEAVWPVTALYLGPVATWGYRRFGRPMSGRWQRDHDVDTAPDRPAWATTAVGVSHCGAGCTLGDIGAEFAVFALGLTVAGTALWAEMLSDFTVALALGIVFQYFAIAPMRGLGLRSGLAQAAKVDVLSLVSFEIGLFAWMALMWFVFFPDPHLSPLSPVYWLFMQIGMIIGFATAWPTNAWLIRRGIKEPM
ncbi:MAG TPA: DUF4396 domain-containing protein [Actinomycetes bacterium]